MAKSKKADEKAAAKKAAEKKLKAKAAQKAKEKAAAKKAKEKAAAKKATRKAVATKAVVEALPAPVSVVREVPAVAALVDPEVVEAVAPSGPTRRQLLVTAGELGIVGRHRMSKEQLEAAVAAH